MDLQLKNRVVIVTGGASGIGASCVRLFVEEGARVAIVDRDEVAAWRLADALEAAREEGRVRVVKAELSGPEECGRAVEEVVLAWGSLHVLVNNAGYNDAVGLDRSAEDFFESVRQNLGPAYAMTHHGRKHLVASRGVVINVGSKVSVTGQGATSGYAAAKGAINALTREWALALAPGGVRVNAVLPAECLTPSYQRWFDAQDNPGAAQTAVARMIPLEQRLTKPEEVAAMIVFLASARSSHTTGQILFVDGGYTHLDRAFGHDHAKWG